MEPPYDALFLVSFGGPEGPDDVMPFLENVVRGKRVPRERLEQVAEHYLHFGGKSPINDQNRALIAALAAALAEAGIELPIYWGNRNWTPTIAEALAEMHAAGVERALGLFTAAYSSYSGCRQYREDIERAQAEVEAAPAVDKIRVWFNHPLWIDVLAERVAEAIASLPASVQKDARIAFTAHSVPLSMAEHSAYERQLQETARLVATQLGRSEWQLVYQSRSGPPQVPWLEPDILDHLRALAQIGTEAVVVAPIGFVSDHLEVVWDLDNEAQQLADELGLPFARAKTAGTHPRYVEMLVELIQERLGLVDTRRAIGELPAKEDVCPTDCCLYPIRRPGRPT